MTRKNNLRNVPPHVIAKLTNVPELPEGYYWKITKPEEHFGCAVQLKQYLWWWPWDFTVYAQYDRATISETSLDEIALMYSRIMWSIHSTFEFNRRKYTALDEFYYGGK